MYNNFSKIPRKFLVGRNRARVCERPPTPDPTPGLSQVMKCSCARWINAQSEQKDCCVVMLPVVT